MFPRKEATAKDNPSLNCRQDSLSGSSFTTQEVSSDQEIVDVDNFKSSPRSPRPKINRLRPNDDRRDEKHFHTITYHNSPVEPLPYDDEKRRKLLLLLQVLFRVNIYGGKVITSVLMAYFFISCLLCDLLLCSLMQLTEIKWHVERQELNSTFFMSRHTTEIDYDADGREQKSAASVS